MDITLNEALHDYYDQRSARYAEKTWVAHEYRLEHLRAWATREYGANCRLSDITERDLVKYFNRFRPPIKEASTFNNYRQYITQFVKFCLSEGWLARDVMRHVDTAPVPEKHRLRLSAEELLSTLTTATPRDRVALAVGMNLAGRAQDLMAIKVGDVNLGNGKISVYIKKTRKVQEFDITAELHIELVRWLQHYAAETNIPEWVDVPNDWTLIPPMQHLGVNPWQPGLGGINVYKTDKTLTHPERIVHKALLALGHPIRKEGFHTLRRSSARELYELAKKLGHGDPITMPQTLLGHKNRQTTEIYLGVSHEKDELSKMMNGRSFLGEVAKRNQPVDDEVLRFGDASA